ncbi:hypothetical protein Dimus_027122 [Dionaea muscipula]
MDWNWIGEQQTKTCEGEGEGEGEREAITIFWKGAMGWSTAQHKPTSQSKGYSPPCLRSPIVEPQQHGEEDQYENDLIFHFLCPFFSPLLLLLRSILISSTASKTIGELKKENKIKHKGS